MPSINWSLRRHDLHIHFRHNFRGISFSILIPLIVKSIQLSLILFDSPHFQRDGGPDDENISFFSSSSRYSSVSLYILWRLAIALWRPVYSGYFRFKRPRSGDGFFRYPLFLVKMTTFLRYPSACALRIGIESLIPRP